MYLRSAGRRTGIKIAGRLAVVTSFDMNHESESHNPESIRVTRSEVIEVNPSSSVEISSSGSDDVLNLIKKVDKAYHDVYDKPSRWYSLRIWKPVLQSFIPLYFLIILMTILYEYLIPLTIVDKIGVGLQISALALALGALAIAMVDVLREKIAQTEEDYIFSKIERLEPSDHPAVKSLIRMRVKSRTVDLQTIYQLDSSIFELEAVLKKLTG